MIARYGFALVNVLLVVAGLAGCKVDSIYPITALDDAQPDAAFCATAARSCSRRRWC